MIRLMELVNLELDKESRFMIWLNFFLLFSIISTGLVYELLRNYITVPDAVAVGLSISLGAIIGIFILLKRKKEKITHD